MMGAAIQDADAIFAKAITIASPQERDAYLAQACGDDAALRRQVEERLAAHFQAAQGPAVPAAAHSAPRPVPAQAGARPSSLALARGATLLILALGVVSIVLAIWAMRQKGEAERARQEAESARAQARKAEEETKQQHTQVEADRQGLADARDQAVANEKAAREQAADLKAALDFFQNRVLSAGRPESASTPVGWTTGLGKDVTLRKAVDVAAAKVSEAFSDRPLAEAALREVLGSTYDDLQEPALAVKEYERALALREALQGEDTPDTVACRNQLAVAYRHAKRTRDADRLLELTRESPTHADALVIRGVLLLSRKKPAEAEKALRECLAIREKLQPDVWSTFEAKSLLGEALREQKDYDKAEPLLKSGYEGLKERQSKIPSQASVYLTRSLARLVQLYDDWGKKDEAGQWRKKLEAAKRMQP
jgi:tetratricopeptide (TPR) repeat protein